MNKIYTMDFGWSGGFTVVAKNKLEALSIMEKNCGQELNIGDIKEYDIIDGLWIEFMGDTDG